MSNFEAKTTEFSGPMEKLLELIEARQIEITRVNLASVTADFIAYVEQLGEQLSPVAVSDFVVVAARLLLLKSKILLPTLELTQEEEADIMDLEKRLKLYREFSVRGSSAGGGKTAAQYLADLWSRSTPLYSRPLLAGVYSAGDERRIFYPAPGITQEVLAASLSRMLEVVSVLMPAQATVRSTVVTLQQKIMELTQRLTSPEGFSFKGKVAREQKEEVIVLFLAVLHMLANRIADVDQSEQFGEIKITATEEGASSEVAGIA